MMRALLIMQLDYFNYASYLSKELETQGYKVTALNDQYPINIGAKLLGKYHSKQIFASTEKIILGTLIDADPFDLILIIRGRSLNRNCVAFLRTKLNNKGKLVGYNWDSFRLNNAPLNWLDLTDRYSTFDIVDAKKYHLPLVELFAATIPKELPVKDISFSALISNHSDRLAFLDKVLRLIDQKNVFIYIYEKNWIRFLVNFLKMPLLYIKYAKFIHFKPLAYPIFIEKLSRSTFTIDFAHPFQSGLTMRCFEAAACGAHIITNNTFILESPYLSKMAIVFDYSIKQNRSDIIKKISILTTAAPHYSVRTAENFINDLVND